MAVFLMWFEVMVDADYCLLKDCGGVLVWEELVCKKEWKLFYF